LSNVIFAFLLGKLEKRYWESSKKAWRNRIGKFVASINIHFHPICNVFEVNAKTNSTK
jgi:hypothetical protein